MNTVYTKDITKNIYLILQMLLRTELNTILFKVILVYKYILVSLKFRLLRNITKKTISFIKTLDRISTNNWYFIIDYSFYTYFTI